MSNDNDDFESLYHRLKESEARHQRAERLLRESEERFSAITAGIDEFFYVVDSAFRFEFASLSVLRAWKKTPSHVIGRTFLDCFPQAQGSDSYDALCRVMRSRAAERYETISPILHRWLEVHIAPTRQGGLSVGFSDIEDRKQAEEALRKSEEKYRTLFETINEGFSIVEAVRDPQGHIVDFRIIETNRAYEAHSGLKQAQGKTLREVMPRYPEERLQVYRDVLQTGTPHRGEYFLEDTQRWYHTNLSRVGGPESNWIGAVFEDITARKGAEQALRIVRAATA